MSAAPLMAIAFVLYLASAVAYGAFLFLGSPDAPAASPPNGLRLGRFGRPLLVCGILVQFAAIGLWCVTTHRSPFASSFGTLAVAAWAIALAFAILDFRVRMPGVGAVALLVACLTLFWGFIQFRSPIAANPILKSQIVSLHVLAILVSFALFALAFGCAALYLLQNHLLKEKNVSPLFRRLPPLATLDSVAYHSVAYALPLLTIGLALGIARIYGGGLAAPPGAWFADPRVIASFVAWCLYVLYVGARLLVGWRGVRLQYIVVAGLLLVLAVYVLPSTTHQFR